MDSRAMVKRLERVGERGQVLPLVAVGLVVLLGFSALAVDLGYWRYEQRLQQSASDSAAIAGAAEYKYSQSCANQTTAAQSDATLNGFTNGATVTVTVHCPPSSGPYSTDPTAVEVLLSASHPSIFAGIFGTATDTVATRSVAHLSTTEAGCVVALGSGGITVSNGTLDAPNCGVVSDGPFTFSGGTIDAGSIGATGTITTTPGANYTGATAAPALPSSDPCPSIAGCASLTSSPPATSPCTNSYRGNGGRSGVTLSPGCYTQLTALGGGGGVTLNPGLYVITGQLLELGGTLTGSGVTFYIASGGSINFSGGTPNLTAPTTGTYTGVLFYQVSSNSNTATLNNSSGGSASCPAATPNFTGLFYAPGAELDVRSGSWDPSAVVVGSLDLSNGSLPECITPLAGGVGSSQRAVLVE